MSERLYDGWTLEELENGPMIETERSLVAHIRELEKALEFYADETNYKRQANPSGLLRVYPDIVSDNGDIARKALRGDT